MQKPKAGKILSLFWTRAINIFQIIDEQNLINYYAVCIYFNTDLKSKKK